MIKKSSIIVLAILLLSIVFITNCSDDDSSKKESLIGTWVLTSMKMTISGYTVTMDPAEMGVSQTLTIYDDNTWRMVYTEDGETSTSTGEWSTSGGKFYVTQDGETEVVDYSLNGDKLEISYTETDDGTTMTITEVYTKR